MKGTSSTDVTLRRIIVTSCKEIRGKDQMQGWDHICRDFGCNFEPGFAQRKAVEHRTYRVPKRLQGVHSSESVKISESISKGSARI